MLHTTKKLETCIDINIEISKVNHYTWIFISRIFRRALEIYFLSKYFSVLVAYELLSQSRKLKRREVQVRAEGLENFLKKNYKRGNAYLGPKSNS